MSVWGSVVGKRIFYATKSWRDDPRFKHLQTLIPVSEFDMGTFQVYENIEKIPNDNQPRWDIVARCMKVMEEGFKDKRKKKCDCPIHLLMQRGCTCGGV